MIQMGNWSLCINSLFNNLRNYFVVISLFLRRKSFPGFVNAVIKVLFYELVFPHTASYFTIIYQFTMKTQNMSNIRKGQAIKKFIFTLLYCIFVLKLIWYASLVDTFLFHFTFFILNNAQIYNVLACIYLVYSFWFNCQATFEEADTAASLNTIIKEVSHLA